MVILTSALLFYIIGFIAGYFTQKDKLKDTISQVQHKVSVYKSPIGVVMRPTQEDLLKRNDPLEKKIEEGKEAMRDTLKNIKELQ